MEKIAGANLQDWLKHRGRPISQEQAVNWLKQLSEILDQFTGSTIFTGTSSRKILCASRTGSWC